MPPMVLAFAYNAAYNGSPLVFGYQEGVLQMMQWPNLEAIAGLLISPSRGLLIYSPFCVFLVLGLLNMRREREVRFYTFAALVLFSGLVFLSMFPGWDGGWGYGTRLLVDILPYAMLLLIPAFARMGSLQRMAFAGMAIWGFVLQSFGLWDNGVRWHWHWPDWKYNVWDVAENEPLFYLKEYVAMDSTMSGYTCLNE